MGGQEQAVRGGIRRRPILTGRLKAGPRQNANHPHALPATQPPAPCGPAKAGPWQNLYLSHASKAMHQTLAPAPQGGLGATPPFWNPVRGPRNVERTYGLFAVSERAANASLFAARRVQGNMRSEGV